MALVKVAAIIVTRGDHNLELRESVLPSLPEEWEVLVWDNGAERLWWRHPEGSFGTVSDLSVYGRYAAIAYTDAELIYVQDDDCVVSEPNALVAEWLSVGCYPYDGRLQADWGGDPRDATDHVVCNMPPEFRHDFYEDHALVGFGAAFHRSAPERAFDWFRGLAWGQGPEESEWLRRTCDIVFTGLSTVILADVPVENLPYAYHYDRMYRQPEHMAERARMRELMIEVRDA